MKGCYFSRFIEVRCEDFAYMPKSNIAFKTYSETKTSVSLKWRSASQVIATQTNKMHKNKKEHLKQ